MYNADLFIIPNSLAKVSGFFPYAQEKKKKFLSIISKENNIAIDPETELLVEVWATSDELASGNLGMHGFTLENEDELLNFPHELPVSIFDGHSEGDIITVKLPVRVRYFGHRSEEDETERVLEFSLKLNQKDYRYRRFGNFEECLEHLKNNYR